MRGDRKLKKALRRLQERGKKSGAKSIITRSGLKLTLMQECFARAFADINSEYFNDALGAYRSVSTSQMSDACARVEAYRLKNHPVVSKRIAEIFEQAGFNDFSVDVEHHKLIKQDKDLSTKLGAIKEYNRVKGRGKESGHIINIEIANYESQGHQDSAQLRSSQEAVSVRDIGESGEE